VVRKRGATKEKETTVFKEKTLTWRVRFVIRKGEKLWSRKSSVIVAKDCRVVSGIEG
jgi:hypothetical protein